MEHIHDISILNLLWGYLLLAIPVSLLVYLRTGLLKSIVIAFLRMTIQLTFIALYLEVIFDKNSIWLNLLWVIIMLLTASFTTIKRTGLNRKYFVAPLILSGITSLLIIDTFFLGLVIKLDYVFEARYFIPISGMILGNSMGHNIIGFNSFYSSIKKDKTLFQFILINTGSLKKALSPFLKESIRKSLSPFIANISTLGLISLPGMMTGQILGGSSPETAIKYQFMIMISIFTACSLNLIISFYFSNKVVFDDWGNLKNDVFSNRMKKNGRKR